MQHVHQFIIVVNCLIKLLVELLLALITLSTAYELSERSHILLDDVLHFGTLLLESFNWSIDSLECLYILVKHSALLCLSCVDLKQIFNSIVVLASLNTFFKDLLTFLSESVKLVECTLNGKNGRIHRNVSGTF